MSGLMGSNPTLSAIMLINQGVIAILGDNPLIIFTH